MKRIYYKFRSFSNPEEIKHLEKCLARQTLYMCNYEGMRKKKNGDAGEGTFYVPADCHKSITKILKQAKSNLMICSVAKHIKRVRLWKEYASNGAGMCIAFSINEPIDGRNVEYEKDYPFMFPSEIERKTVYDVAKEILKYKLDKFDFEDEYRFFKVSYGHNSEVKIKIHAIHLGWNISEVDEKRWREFIANHCKYPVKIIRRRKPIV